MKNIVENQCIKTDKPLPMSYEALKAERDAQQKRADALAVENQALKSKAAELVHEASEAYSAYNATIKEPDGDFMDMQTLYEMQCIETPATDAALAAIRNEATVRALKHLCECQLISATVAELKADELREGK
ncbi:TPA: hypothetical protein SMI48_002205 [Serratia marcescens]|nr:hypothetical protein [Serratia marcescens]